MRVYEKNIPADKCNHVYQNCVNLPTGSWQIQSEWSNAIAARQQIPTNWR